MKIPNGHRLKLSEIKNIKKEIVKVNEEIDNIKKSINLLSSYRVN
jgi:hypothetical protein